MDRKIKKKKWTVKRIITVSFGVVVVSGILYSFIFADRRSKLNVDKDKITISTVKYGSYQDFIPQTGTVLPIETRYLDIIRGGTIRKIVKESGAIVEKGDTILLLANDQLEREVMTQETSLYEQLNIGRQTQLQLETNSLNLESQLAAIDNEIALGKPQYERYKKLYEQGMVSQREFEEVEKPYLYNLRLRELQYSSFKKDSLNKEYRRNQQEMINRRMAKSLDAVGNILDNLIIRAPIDGQLATPDLELGQNVSQGERVGQVDVLDNFKVRVSIDELYLPRIEKGLIGRFDYTGKTYTLKITKIFPNIEEGRFQVDMEFVGETPQGIKRGYSPRIKIDLGNPAQATLLPVGGFYSSTGGNWVYVVDESGSKAVKKNIRIGRKNTDYFEILDGLQEGERVITSSYDNFGDNEVLVLKE
ncbi:efflux RND transporter periplasmic adaptor subunit [Chondrinema litorale]|uniref:efflux RND transporter periplasmic adaptor subunit n=1 Tax=Chondrinema litorale TaxID=2994555 RepID=UPI002542AFA6|nr:efflux RND transporter periplasmic adaptor subunit [Chondrinema litorale]UZR94654.1 efflux RND transporter periplasmic adaptor subunit [Chondrinema litorale]